MTNEKSCCGAAVRTEVADGLHFYWCEKCGRRGSANDAATAWAAFLSWKPVAKKPHNAREFVTAIHGRESELRTIAAPFVMGVNGLFQRIMAKNADYIASLSSPAYDKVWETEEGAASYMKAYEEAIEAGALLPDMGSIVPYGGTVKLILDVEAFRFALTTGASSPFEWVNIDPIYEGDIPFLRWGKRQGDFFIELSGAPIDRGNLAGVAVYGMRRGTGKIDGDMFPVKKLDAMAQEYSKPYQKSIDELTAYERAKSEGKEQFDADGRPFVIATVESKDGGKYAEQDAAMFRAAEASGTLKKDRNGEYAEKEMPKKGGGTWTKKVYRSSVENPGTETKRIYFDEIDCQYTSASGDKMYMKLAGKSFLGPYMKTRNSAAAIHEMQESEPSNMVSELVTRTADSLVCGGRDIITDEMSAESATVQVAEKAPIISAKKEKAPAATGKDDSLF